jgi:uncharacterized protein YbbC (DUF1343 family)
LFYYLCFKTLPVPFNYIKNAITSSFPLIRKDPEITEPPATKKPVVTLGDDQITNKYNSLIKGKKVGVITNQTGVTSNGTHILDVLTNYKDCTVTCIYAPEHGLDGTTSAGKYVASYTHPTYNIPVYSLYNDNRMPKDEMLKNVDVLIYDIQDIGCRSYTFISTLNYCMKAAAKNKIQVIVLDRPDPLGGDLVDGFTMEDSFISFVGIDKLPYVYGMTIGELSKYFNRNINCNLTVVPMQNYTRSMTFKETGLTWIPTSPMIPTVDSAINYSATGICEGISELHQENYFNWVGGPNIKSASLSSMLNNAKLEGVTFEPCDKNNNGGVNIKITDYKKYNPIRTGIYILSYGHNLTAYTPPKGKDKDGSPVMFEKIMGTNKMSTYLEQGLTPETIIKNYTPPLQEFEKERQNYLIYK